MRIASATGILQSGLAGALRESALRTLQAEYGSADPVIRVEAATEVARAVSEPALLDPALDLLIAALEADQEEVRWRAAVGLWLGRKAARAEPALRRALKDPAETVQRFAREALDR